MEYKIFHGNEELGVINSKGEVSFSGNKTDIEPVVERFPLFLSNSLPEGERYENMLLNSNTKNPSQFDHVSVLDEIPGDFSMVEADDRTIIPFPTIELSVAKVKTDLSPNMFFVNSRDSIDMSPSFSGYQDKFTAKAVIQDGQLLVTSVNRQSEIGNIIVKPGRRFPFVAENECVCMRLAEKVGLEVPKVFLISHPDTKWQLSHFCVERFDFNYSREPLKKKTMMEFASLMGLDSKSKYLITTEEVFDLSEDFLNKDDLKKFAKAYLFGFIVGNGDMHTKNFSVFVEKGNEYRLAAVYDMMNTKVHGFKNSLALTFGKDFSENPNVEDFSVFMQKYIPVDEISQMVEKIKKNLPDVLSFAFSVESKNACPLSNFRERQKTIFRDELGYSILEQADNVEKVVLAKGISSPPLPQKKALARDSGRGGR